MEKSCSVTLLKLSGFDNCGHAQAEQVACTLTIGLVWESLSPEAITAVAFVLRLVGLQLFSQ